jgi:hypothetical protein
MTDGCESLINAIQSEPCIWDTNLNAGEDEKKLAWNRICDNINCKNGLLHQNNTNITLLFAIYMTNLKCKRNSNPYI